MQGRGIFMATLRGSRTPFSGAWLLAHALAGLIGWSWVGTVSTRAQAPDECAGRITVLKGTERLEYFCPVTAEAGPAGRIITYRGTECTDLPGWEGVPSLRKAPD